MALLDFATQQTIKKISPNNQTKYADIELEVENNELRDLLGVAFLQDIQNNPNIAANEDLIEGTTFTDCDGNTIAHRGLQFVLAYLVYSSYIGKSFVEDTFTGLVQKTRQDATLLPEGSIRRLQEESRKIGLSEFEIIKNYLNQNSTLYPLWAKCKTTEIYTPKIYGVKKTKSNGNNHQNINICQ